MLITNSGVGGAENVFYQHASSFADYFEVTECYFSLDKGASPNEGRNKILSLDNKTGSNILDKLLKLRSRVKRLKEIKQKGGYDVCISHMDGANWINVLSSSPKCKSIACIHGSLIKDRGRGKGFQKYVLNELITPFIYRKADRVVTVSDHIKMELQGLMGKEGRIESIPNFFDLELIREKLKEPVSEKLNNILTSFPILIAVGRLAPEKNFRTLIRIFNSFRFQKEGLKLFIVGAGVEKENLVEEARQLSLKVYTWDGGEELKEGFDVYFLGLNKNPFPLIAKAKAFLLTSHNEGFPLVLVESMLSRTPVVSYDCISGPRQIIAPELPQSKPLTEVLFHETGVLIPQQAEDLPTEKDLQRWNQSLEFALDENKAATIVDKAEKRAEDFSKQTILKRWIALINETVDTAH